MPRNEVVEYAFRALRILTTGRWTVSEIGAELGRGRRTVYRLVEVIEAQGLRVERQREGVEVYYRISREELERWLCSRPNMTRTKR